MLFGEDVTSTLRPLRRRRLCLLLSVGAWLLSGCSGEERDLLTVQVGPDQVYRFEPEAAFAHYFELPSRRDVLRIVVASYPVSCTKFRPPSRGDVFITVTLTGEEGRPLGAGKYLYTAEAALEDGDVQEAKTEEKSEGKARALPFVRLSEDARALPPGGFVTVTDFTPEPAGIVSGEFAFRDESGGAATDASMTALLGKFRVKLCQLVRDPSRQLPDPAK